MTQLSQDLRAARAPIEGDAILNIAERFFQRSGRTQFPTVRYVARRLRCRQSEIEELEGYGFCLDGVNVEGWKLGDLEIYVTSDEAIARIAQSEHSK